MAKQETKKCFWHLGTEGHMGRFGDFFLVLVGDVSWIRYCVCGFVEQTGFLHRVKTINLIPQNPSHSHLPCFKWSTTAGYPFFCLPFATVVLLFMRRKPMFLLLVA